MGVGWKEIEIFLAFDVILPSRCLVCSMWVDARARERVRGCDLMLVVMVR